MPSGLFMKDGDRWVFAGPTPASFNGYPKDHADLLVRYMFQFTPEELNTAARARAGAGRSVRVTGGKLSTAVRILVIRQAFLNV